MQKQSGFTLIEVLIALSIVAFSLVALMHSNSSTLDRFSNIEQKTLANIIINNLTIELRLSTRPKLGIKDDEYKMAEKTWLYSNKTEKTPIEDITKTTINLFKNKDDKSAKKPIATAIVYLNSPIKTNKPDENKE